VKDLLSSIRAKRLWIGGRRAARLAVPAAAAGGKRIIATAAGRRKTTCRRWRWMAGEAAITTLLSRSSCQHT